MKRLAWSLPVLLAACIPYPHVEVKPEPKYSLFTQNAHDPASDFSARFPLHESPQGAEWGRLQQDRFIMRMEALKPSWQDARQLGPDALYWAQRHLQHYVASSLSPASVVTELEQKCRWEVLANPAPYLKRPDFGPCRDVAPAAREAFMEQANAWNTTWRQALTPVDRCVTELRGLFREDIAKGTYSGERAKSCAELDRASLWEAMSRADRMLPQWDRTQYPLAGRS